MPVEILANIPNLQDRQSLDVFSFANQDHHRNVINHIAQTKSELLSTYDLDPINPEQFQTWLQLHQDSHNQINGVLGIQGVDLTSVDFRDQGEAAAWSRLHMNEHIQWQLKTGIA